MRARLLLAPPWVKGTLTGLLAGLFYCGVMALYHRLELEEPWSESVTTCAALGAFFGVIMGMVTRLKERRLQDAPEFDELRALPPAKRITAINAAAGGPVPDDPAIRQAALRRVSGTLARATSLQPVAIVFFVVPPSSRARSRSSHPGRGPSLPSSSRCSP